MREDNAANADCIIQVIPYEEPSGTRVGSEKDSPVVQVVGFGGSPNAYDYDAEHTHDMPTCVPASVRTPQMRIGWDGEASFCNSASCKKRVSWSLMRLKFPAVRGWLFVQLPVSFISVHTGWMRCASCRAGF